MVIVIYKVYINGAWCVSLPMVIVIYKVYINGARWCVYITNGNCNL